METHKSSTEKAEVENQKNPKGSEPENDTSAKDAKKVNTDANAPGDGLDQWNDRLDENMESEAQGDPVADDKAKDYNEKYGSGDQSDEGQ